MKLQEQYVATVVKVWLQEKKLIKCRFLQVCQNFSFFSDSCSFWGAIFGAFLLLGSIFYISDHWLSCSFWLLRIGIQLTWLFSSLQWWIERRWIKQNIFGCSFFKVKCQYYMYCNFSCSLFTKLSSFRRMWKLGS